MKKLILSLAALAALASCSSNEENENLGINNNDPVEIKVGRASLEATTKAPFEGEISGSNTLTAKVMASSASGNYVDNLLTNGNGTIKFEDNGTTAKGFETPVYYPNDNEVYLIGMYPDDGATSWSVNATTATRAIDGNSDIMFAKQVTTTKETNGKATLAFNHLLTKLNISVKANGADDQAAWNGQTLSKIVLSQVAEQTPSSQVQVTIADGTTDFTGGTDAETPCYGWSGGINYTDTKFESETTPITTSLTPVAYVICEPVAAPDGDADYTLTLTVGGQEYPVPVGCNNHASLTSGTAGYEIDVEITFHGTAIMAKASVTPWADGGAASGNVGGGE